MHKLAPPHTPKPVSTKLKVDRSVIGSGGDQTQHFFDLKRGALLDRPGPQVTAQCARVCTQTLAVQRAWELALNVADIDFGTNDPDPPGA